MKYLRRIASLVIGIVFFTALVISIGMIFAVRNINVTLISYGDDCAYLPGLVVPGNKHFLIILVLCHF